ncbi:hypothetical protein C9975_03045 [Thalassospira xiamenensis]|nr:hypothetical protein C9975_03045 [Thalassospira xiamenensis]
MVRNLITLIEGLVFIIGVALLSNALLNGADLETVIWLMYGIISLVVITANVQHRHLGESRYNIFFQILVETFCSSVVLCFSAVAFNPVLAAVSAIAAVVCIVIMVLMTLYYYVK